MDSSQIKGLRESCGLSQVQLAVSAGVSVGVIYRIERGESVTTGKLDAVVLALQKARGGAE
jgi:transcriptional regulator with XRE-family HTH domain